MQNSVVIPQSVFKSLVERVDKLEKVVFTKKYTLKAVDIYEKEKSQGKLKKLESIEELFS